MAVEPVECVNCGGEAWVSIAGLVVALLATGLAFAAYKAAAATVRLTRQEVAMSSAEHAEFMKRLAARAKFTVTVAPVATDADGYFTRDVDRERALIRIGIDNRLGERAAGPTFVRLLAPARNASPEKVALLQWEAPETVVEPRLVSQQPVSRWDPE